jgi:glutaredoxin
MKTALHPITATTRLKTVTVCAALLLAASLAQAQAVYRVVGPDGRVTFSDKPPAAGNATTSGAGGKQANAEGASMPYELRQVANKYPVTLYTASNCNPCDAGRAMLNSRGIPFAEKTISTNEDAEALQRMSSDASLPFLTIGGQQLKGYSDAEWSQFLNAAGYPKKSLLPASYRNPAAAPLVTVQKPAPAAVKPAERPAPQAPEPSRAPEDNASNPAGIRF